MGPMLFGAISMGPQQFGADSKGLHVFEAMSSEAKTKKAQYYRGPDEQWGPTSSEPSNFGIKSDKNDDIWNYPILPSKL